MALFDDCWGFKHARRCRNPTDDDFTTITVPACFYAHVRKVDLVSEMTKPEVP